MGYNVAFKESKANPKEEAEKKRERERRNQKWPNIIVRSLIHL